MKRDTTHKKNEANKKNQSKIVEIASYIYG